MNDLLGGRFDVMCDQTTNTTSRSRKQNQGLRSTKSGLLLLTPPLVRRGQASSVGLARDVGAERIAEEASDKLVAALQAALKDPKVIERFASLGTEPVKAELATPAALKSHLTAEVPRWSADIKAAGAKGN